MIPASIRNLNPGAMYPGKSASLFGAVGHEVLKSKDGEHKIATFPTHVSGAAAQFHLLATKYTGLTIKEAITKWCGGFRAQSYSDLINKKAGLTPNTELTLDLIKDANLAIPMAKAMALQEAGSKYPMTDEEWKTAHDMAMNALAMPDKNGAGHTEAPWLAQYLKWEKDGVKEVPGPGSNPTIDEMFLLCGHPKGKFRDDTAWCAISGYAALQLSGVDIPPASKNTMARSFLEAFPRVANKDVQPGDFRIEARGQAPFGHVDCVIAVHRDAGTVEVIGGNMGDKFTRRVRPISGALGYVRPKIKPVAAQVPEPTLPAPETVTPKDLAPLSRKVSILRNLVNLAKSLLVSVGGLFTLDNLGIAKGALDDLYSMAQQLAFPAAIVALVGGVFLGRYLLKTILEDYRAGRWVPSKS